MALEIKTAADFFRSTFGAAQNKNERPELAARF
jgi:hypothetical protein